MRQFKTQLIGLLILAAGQSVLAGGNFAKGSFDLGGLSLCQSSTFNQVWATHDVGANNQSVTFYEPSALPDGCSMLGHYSQVSNKSVDGCVLGVIDEANGAVAKPVNYTLIWSNENENLTGNQDGIGYIWLPVPPEGYKALGHIVTTTKDIPSLDKVRCVRADFAEECSVSELISANEVNVGISVGLGIEAAAKGVPLGTFSTQNDTDISSLPCLKNHNAVTNAMPDMDQVKGLMARYGPILYLHPDEEFLPSSVEWFFKNGALLYHRLNESEPIDPSGSNLPQGGSNDGAYWIDLPVDDNAKEQVKKGDLTSATGYLHVKAMQGGTITDLAIWVFYPFNGPATAKIGSLNIPLGEIGSHVSDWEHVTLRISNLDGKLQSIYFSQHSGGQWVSASDLEYLNNSKPIAYASRNGHAAFPHPGLVLQGNEHIGLRNDMAASNLFLDLSVEYVIISADYLNITEPPWINYFREWGPKVSYNIVDQIKLIKKLLLFKKLQDEFEKFVNSLPAEVLGQEGPTGPKVKDSWNGDEKAFLPIPNYQVLVDNSM